MSAALTAVISALKLFSSNLTPVPYGRPDVPRLQIKVGMHALKNDYVNPCEWVWKGNCTPWQTDLFNSQSMWLQKLDSERPYMPSHTVIIIIIIIIIYTLTARVAGAPQMISQPVSSIFPCSPLPSGTLRTVVFPPLLLSALSSSPFTEPCKVVLARPDEWETWPYHCSLLFGNCGHTVWQYLLERERWKKWK